MNQSTKKTMLTYFLLCLAINPGCLIKVNGNNLEQADQAEFANGEHEASISIDSLTPLATSTVECEPIHFVGLCSNMAYKLTKMPNFFNDTNQIEVADRLKNYQLNELVNSNCSKHVRDYICELMTPVCIEKESMRDAQKTFDIYPCRSFCRMIRRDCGKELMRLNQKLFKQQAIDLLPGFDCDMLPYESNGGTRLPTGPCHEISEQEYPSQSMNNQLNGQQPALSDYRPYETKNFPPFITDTSRIDTNFIKPLPEITKINADAMNDYAQFPSAGGEKTNNLSNLDNQQQEKSAKTQNLATQFNFLIQGIVMTLVKYSNALAIITLVTLLIVLNSRRLGLHKIKSYLSIGRTSSSASSENSRRQLHTGKQSTTTAYHRSHHVVSPSSSSRSLMLFAGNNKQPPNHQLVPAPMIDNQSESPQKLLDGLSRRPIFSGTMERRQNDNRYLIMQPSSRQQQHPDKQQLFDTLGSQSSSNQYDYIEISSDQRSATSDQRRAKNHPQQQLFSNILLSSPSRQVYLYGSQQAQQQQHPHPHPHPHPHQHSIIPPPLPPQSGRKQVHAPYLPPNLSPYATPGISGLALGVDPQHQRSFQRRTRKNSASSWQHRGTAMGVAGSGLAGAAYTPASSSGSDASSPPSSSGQSNVALAPTLLQNNIRR